MRQTSGPTSCSIAISVLAAALLALGIVMVFSASASLTATSILENPLKNPSIRQASYSCFGLLALLLVGLWPHDFWAIRRERSFQPASWLLVIVCGLLAAVLVPGIGEERNGARRWLALGQALSFQPSELAKVAIVVFIAAHCAHWGNGIRQFWIGFLPLIFVLVFVAGLVGKEDFGTAALLLAVGGFMLLAAGCRIWHLVLLSMPVLVGMVYLIKAEPYRVQRLLAFMNPDADPQGAGYHQVQSLITIASGGWWGRGLGGGIQKYGYLPESRTDFIFAVICEELGIVGGAAVIGLFAAIVWQGRKASMNAPTEFGRLLALGATLMIGLQAAMNVAVVTVSVPTKGIGLPLVSAGGTGVIFFSLLVGLLVNVARRTGEPVSLGAFEKRDRLEPRAGNPQSAMPDPQ